MDLTKSYNQSIVHGVFYWHIHKILLTHTLKLFCLELTQIPFCFKNPPTPSSLSLVQEHRAQFLSLSKVPLPRSPLSLLSLSFCDSNLFPSWFQDQGLVPCPHISSYIFLRLESWSVILYLTSYTFLNISPYLAQKSTECLKPRVDFNVMLTQYN